MRARRWGPGRAAARILLAAGLAALAGGCGGHDDPKKIFIPPEPAPTGCTLQAPAASPASGAVEVTFSLAAAAPTQVTFSYSIDEGATFVVATADLTSPLANPASGVNPGVNLQFVWDSALDLPGLPVQTVLLALDTSTAGSCQVSFDLTNATEPTCSLAGPAASPAGPEVVLAVQVLDDQDDPADATLVWSGDGGITLSPATLLAASAGTLGGFTPTDPDNLYAAGTNQVQGLPGGPGVTLTWDAAADGVGLLAPTDVILILLVEDGSTGGAGPFSFCQTPVTVLADRPPSCTITSPAGGVLNGPVDVEVQLADPESSPLDVTFAYSLDDGATFAAATAEATSPLANPATGVAPGPATFRWDAAADLGGGGTVSVLFRVTVDDGVDPGGSRPVSCETSFAWGTVSEETLLSLSAVTELGATGLPVPGAPAVGNPAGDYAGLDSRRFNALPVLRAGGSPVLLYSVGETARPVIQGNLALAGAVDLSDAATAWGTTTYASSDPAVVSVAADGTLTAEAANRCATITATVVPDLVAVPGGATRTVDYAACVDLAGVDMATRCSGGPRLVTGELDADLPGLPSGPPAPAAGGAFGVLLAVSTGATPLGAHSVQITWDLAVLAVDTGAPGSTSGVSGSTTDYGGPTVANASTPGQLTFNHFNIAATATGCFDLAEVHYTVQAAGLTSFEVTVTAIADSVGNPLGSATPRAAPAASATSLEFP